MPKHITSPASAFGELSIAPNTPYIQRASLVWYEDV